MSRRIRPLIDVSVPTEGGNPTQWRSQVSEAQNRRSVDRGVRGTIAVDTETDNVDGQCRLPSFPGESANPFRADHPARLSLANPIGLALASLRKGRFEDAGN
jgi:hypothetical protein